MSVRAKSRVIWVSASVLWLSCQKTSEPTLEELILDRYVSVEGRVEPSEPPLTPPHLMTLRELASAAGRPAPLMVCRSQGKLPLDAARDYYDQRDYEKALACAAQASALTPNDVQAHAERGNAFGALGRWDEAKLAYARALAVDPESLDALMGAAHLYGVSLPSNRENDELASTYAERGLDLARSANDVEVMMQFGRLSAMAFNDLGQAYDALDRADFVLSKMPRDADARYERALALFELCRLAEAKAVFLSLAKDPEKKAHVHHHLGLLFERENKQTQADKHFAMARSISPGDFPKVVLLSTEEFRSEVAKAVAALPEDIQNDLKGIPVATEDLPGLADLTAGDPPLSPTILGLFRGPPLNEPCEVEPGEEVSSPGPCRSVVLYRRNLARAVKTRAEFIDQIRVTLLHEAGHLRGEGDDELAARGLE
jgi:tetratricopeptide (TPR) repeat protein